ncbi:MAG: V-type ATP synthase subunit F [Ruminococcus sp.]|nr:V-type ATP synthase subunit F [Ruminococcus sp.]
MYKVAVIGDRDSIFGFAALGLDVYFADTAKEALTVFKEITDGRYTVIYITEMLASQLTDDIEKFSLQPSPAIIFIPGVKGNTGQGIEQVKKSVEKAVGSDIIFNN